jgi:hypothetical protein
MVTWGKSGGNMKLGHMIAVAAVLYEGGVGIAELATTSSAGSTSSSLTSIAALPTVGSLAAGVGGTTLVGPGIIDLVVAAGIYFFVLHDSMFG